MLLLLPSLFKAPDILQKVEEYTGHCIVPEGVVCTPLTLIPTLGLLCFVGAILSPATPASYNQLQTTTNNNVVTTKMSTSVPHTTSYSYNLDELYLGLPRATETVVGVNTIQDPAIELHLTATDVVITPYMQRRLNATTTMDVDEAVDRITASGSCMITDVPSATDMIWEDHTTDESGLMHYCSNCQRQLPWHQYVCHNQKAYVLYCCNDYGEMKYFMLLRYLNLMWNGYPLNY